MGSPETFAKRITAQHYHTQLEIANLRKGLETALRALDGGPVSKDELARARALIEKKGRGE